MANAETPTSAMYAMLKQLKVSNKEAAGLLLSDTQKYGDKFLRDRIEERTFLHRLTHGDLGFRSPTYYADLPQVAQILCSRITNGSAPVSTMAELTEYLAGEPLNEMVAACKDAGLDGSLLANLVNSVRDHADLSDADKASAIMLAYIGVGCLENPSKAIELVNDMLSSIAMTGFRTGLMDDSGYTGETEPQDVKIALVRVIDGGLDLNGMHVLSTDPAGTVIGSLATDANSINDVGPLVSKRHLHVYCTPEGQWFVQGLGSTNGTKLIDGATKSEVVVEPPKAESAGVVSGPVPLHVGDALHLAGTTVFLAMKVV